MPTTPENWPTVKTKKVWAVAVKGKGKQILKGDKIIFYVNGTLHFHAIYEVKNDWHEPTVLWPDETHVGDYAVSEIDLTEVQRGFASVNKLLPSLDFIKNHRRKGLYLRGTSRGSANMGKPISEYDYNLILDELKRNQDEPDFRKVKEQGNKIEDLIDLPSDSHMHEKIHTEKKTPEEIFNDVQKGRCAVPDFQRYWTWKRRQIEELWESIFRKYYVGSLLTWNSSGQKLGKTPIIGGGEMIEKTDLILDGQQRITAICYAVMAPDLPLPNMDVPYEFFVNINALLDPLEDSSEIVNSYSTKKAEKNNFHDRKTQYEKKIFPLTGIQDLSEWVFGFYDYLKSDERYEDGVAKKYRKKLEELLKSAWSSYEIPVVRLPETLPLENVATVFERINNSGTSLGVFDLLNARFIIHDIVLKKQWEAIKAKHDNLRKWHEDFKNDKVPLYIIQAMSLSKSGMLGRKQLLELDEKYKTHDKFQSREFLNDYEEMAGYVENAVVRTTSPIGDWFGATRYDLIPHTVMVPVLAALLREIQGNLNIPRCMKKIKYWYWNSVLSEKYSGSSDTFAESDFKLMKQWFDDDALPFKQEQPDTFDVKKKSSSLYKAIMGAMACKGALDFNTGQPQQFSTLEDHHIFPRSKAEKFGAKSNIDSVLNRALIDARTNKYIKNKDPSEYLTEIMNMQKIAENELQKRLSTHLISTDAFTCLMRDDFAGFVRERETTIRDEFEELTKWHVGL